MPPTDTQQDMRTEMVLTMEKLGIEIEAHHHEVATAGQAEIDMQFDTLVAMADKLLMYKYVVKNVARAHGKTATFMPKPLFGDNGSGMHCHQSLWKDGKPLFAGDGYAGLSKMALLLHRRHPEARARRSRRSPTRRTNCYKRLVPGYEAPVNLALLVRATARRRAASRCTRRARRRSASRSASRTRRCNPYLAFAAMLMAGLDGIENKIDPGEPLDKDIYALSPEEAKDVPHDAGQPRRGAARARGRTTSSCSRATCSPRT